MIHWILGLFAVGLIARLVYRSRRSDRARLVLDFTERIGPPVTEDTVDRVDRHIYRSTRDSVLGGLAGIVLLEIVFLSTPDLVPRGLANNAVVGILIASLAAGSALAVADGPRTSDATTVAHRRSLFTFLHPAWVAAAVKLAAASVALVAVLAVGGGVGDAGQGTPTSAAATLAGLAVLGTVLATLLSRRKLARQPSGGSELERRWSDAFLAAEIRGLWVAAVALGSAAVVVTAASFVPPDSFGIGHVIVGVLGIAPVVLLVLPPSRRTTQRLAHAAG